MIVELILVTGVVGLVLLLVLSTMRAQQAVRLSSFLALLLMLLVPLNRIEGVDALRAAVPVAVSLLTLFAVGRAGKFSIRALPPIVLMICFTGIVSVASAQGATGMLIWGLGAFTILAGLLQGAVLKATDNVVWFARSFVFLACAFSLYGIFEVLTRATPIWRGALILADGQSTTLAHPFLATFARGQATFGHPLPFALVIIAALAIVLTFPVRNWLTRFFMLALLTSGLFASGSRNALVLAVLLLLYLGIRRLGRLRVPGYILLGIVAVAFLNKFLDGDVIMTGSFTHRVGALEAIGKLLTARPLDQVAFGSGAGGVPRLYAEGLLQSDGFQAVDNQYTHTLATDGVIGLVLLVIVGIIAWKMAAPGIRVLILVFAAQGMIFDFLVWPTTGYVAWLVLGVALTTAKTNRELTDQSGDLSLVAAPAGDRTR